VALVTYLCHDMYKTFMSKLKLLHKENVCTANMATSRVFSSGCVHVCPVSPFWRKGGGGAARIFVYKLTFKPVSKNYISLIYFNL
jgi:hypothetical protein